MKKLKIVLVCLVVFFILVCVGIYTALKVFVNEDKIRNYIVEYAKTNLNREVSFDSLSFHFFGLDLNNFKISEKSTFNDGTFVKTDKLAVDISLLPLLHKEVKINNITLKSLNVNIIKSKEGIFNFDDIVQNFQTPQDEQKQQDTTDTNKNNKDSQSPFNLKINNFNIENSNVSFKDYMNDLYIDVENFNMSIKHFSFVKEFLCKTSFNIKYKQDKLDMYLPVKSEFLVNLNNFDMNKIFLNIKELSTSIKDSSIKINGTVNGITVCDIDCNISLKDINEKILEGFVDTQTKFNISSIDFKTKTTVNISSMNAKIDSLSLVLPDSSSDISGSIDWGKQDLEYDLKANANILLNGFANFLPQSNISGKLNANITANQNNLDGTINLENISCSGSFGNISELTTDLYLKINSKTVLQKIDFKNFNADELIFKINNLVSKYNDSKLVFNAALEQGTKSKLEASLKAENFSDDTLRNFYESPVKFIIPNADMDLSTDFDLKKKAATINKFNIKLLDSLADIKGNINWNNSKNFIYNLKLNLNLLLDNIAKNFPKYNLAGQIKSNAAVSNTNFSGTLNCKNLAFECSDIAKVSKLNLDLSAKSNKNITVTTLNGVLNGGNFKANGSYVNNDVKLNLTMDKLVINKSSQTTTSNAETKKQDSKNSETQNKKTQKTNQTAKKSKDLNLNIYTNIDISQIDVPYLTSKKATLNTAVTGIKNYSFAKANGTLDLTISSGTITNTKEFAQNKYAKTFLTIFNVLNNDKENTSNIQKKSKDDIVYNNIKADVIFTDGLMKTKDVSIAMPATTITTTGTINFANEALNLIVNTGAYVSMKITGTLSEPKTSFDVVGTVSDVLSKTVLKNLFGNK